MLIGRREKLKITAVMTGVAAALLLAGVSVCFAAAADTDKPSVALGKRIYRDGILASGESLKGYIRGDVPAPGTSFTCVNCHMLSGLGSVEGGVHTTPTIGKFLYQYRDKSGTGNNRRIVAMPMQENRPKNGQIAVESPPARPAYTDESLAGVLRGGKDPIGRMLNPVMPRYNLGDRDMANLIAYLKTLSAEHSPGVDKYSINFATIITEEVPQEQVEAMLKPIEDFVKASNKQQKQLEDQQVRLRERPLDMTYRPVKHSRWILKGKPDTWKAQLAEYYKKQPVFALIGGVTTGDWQPIHAFCDENEIPCILPSTDLPVVASGYHYTLYFSKGYYQEGEAAARYLQSENSSETPYRILQLVTPSQKGKALADGFTAALKGNPLYTIVTVEIDPKKVGTKQVVQLLEKEKADLLAFWGDAAGFAELKGVAAEKTGLKQIFVSSSYLGSDLLKMPETLRGMTYITYPVRPPQDEKRFERFIDKSLSPEAQKVQSRSLSMLRVLTQALRDVKGDFYRDYLFDVMAMRKDFEFTQYERLSFGPEQRYAVKGCYVVQLSPGDKPEIIKKSEWVIH